ncbi:hypothetical protein TSUD_318230 [Trifolium subterraneum]|uniref:Uncharacterized protein n=1 Tax=Trifolium subterraneum TaxID=3900 RepID=A0A2Z6NLF4_TRISU|nr:hypothetical protein TSUD_318230 [Trifolium subterraneum]
MVNEFYSIDDANDFSSGHASLSNEVSHCDGGDCGGGDVEFNSNFVLLNGKTVKELGSVVARPPYYDLHVVAFRFFHRGIMTLLVFLVFFKSSTHYETQ